MSSLHVFKMVFCLSFLSEILNIIQAVIRKEEEINVTKQTQTFQPFSKESKDAVPVFFFIYVNYDPLFQHRFTL